MIKLAGDKITVHRQADNMRVEYKRADYKLSVYKDAYKDNPNKQIASISVQEYA